MPKVAVYNLEGSQTGELTLSDEIFASDINKAVIHSVVRAQLANKRQGTKSALTRTEVRGGGKKPYRQKGTGRARQGSTRAPQFTKGGVVFAPKPRDYRQSVNKKVKRLAMKSALSSKVSDGDIIVYDALDISAPKTKEMVKFVKALNLDKRTVLVMDSDDVNVILASRNNPTLSTLPVEQINTYDVVANAKVVLTKAAAEKIMEVYGA